MRWVKKTAETLRSHSLSPQSRRIYRPASGKIYSSIHMRSVGGQHSDSVLDGELGLAELRSALREGSEAARQRNALADDVETLHSARQQLHANATRRHLHFEGDDSPRPDRRGPATSAAQALASKIESIATRPLVLERYRQEPSADSPTRNVDADAGRHGVQDLEQTLTAIRVGAWDAEDYGLRVPHGTANGSVGDVMASLEKRKEALETRRRVSLEKDWIRNKPMAATSTTSPTSHPWRDEVRSHLSPRSAQTASSPSLGIKINSSPGSSPSRGDSGAVTGAPLADAVSLLNQRVERLRQQILHLQEENANLKLDVERRRTSEETLAEENTFLRRELSELAFVSREDIQRRARKAAFSANRNDQQIIEALNRRAHERLSSREDGWRSEAIRWQAEAKLPSPPRAYARATLHRDAIQDPRYDFLDRSLDGLPSALRHDLRQSYLRGEI